MISPAEKKIVISAFGKKYSPELIEILTKKKLLNAQGNPYSQESIRYFVNGDRENLAVENAIVKAAIAAKSRKASQLKKRSKLR